MPARPPVRSHAPWPRLLPFLILAVCGWTGVLPGAGSPSFAKFDSSLGLVADRVTAIHQDARGYLWVGTSGGISRFDGENFENFRLADEVASDSVTSIVEEEGGTLWVLTSTGVKGFDGREFRGLTTADGLPDNAVTAMIQDRRGNLWVGTKKGIAVFKDRAPVAVPGLEGLKDKRVSVLFEDSAGRIWAGFRQDGLYLFDKDRWREFTTDDGLPHDIVNDVREDGRGRIWIATHRGVAIFENARLEPAPFQDRLPSSIIYAILPDAAGGLWFRASNAGVARWDGASLQTWSTANGLAGDYVTSWAEDGDGVLWLGTNHGLSRWADGKLLADPVGTTPLTEHIGTIEEDRDGHVWIGTEQGLLVAEPDRITVVIRDERAETRTWVAPARVLFKDHRGGLWFPASQGLGFTDGTETVIYTERDGLPAATIQHIVEDAAGGLWAATPAGIAVLSPGSGRFTPIRDPLVTGHAFKQVTPFDNGILLVREDNAVLFVQGGEVADLRTRGLTSAGYTLEDAVVDAQQTLWLQTTGGVIRYDGTASRYFPSEEVVTGGFLDRMLADPRKGIWIGTSKGLVRCEDGSFHRYAAPQGLPDGLVRPLGFDSRGALWMLLLTAEQNILGRRAIGLVRGEGSVFTLFTAKEGLPSNDIVGFFEHPAGTLWFRTDKGVSRFDGQAFQSLTVSDGLANNLVLAAVEGPRGDLWLGTRNGISKVREGQISSYSTADGLLDGTVEDLSFDSGGRLWIRTVKGVHRLEEGTVPPRIEMVDLAVGNRAQTLGPDLRFRHDENNLTFRFQGINLLEGAASLRYLYRMEGLSGEWFGPVRETKVSFHGLKPGEYRFQVKALNRALMESRPPAEFAFTILPPFWERWWFRVGSLLFLGLAAYGVYRVRLRSRLEKARILNELKAAQDMQMGLMPASDPRAPGFDISGLCKPAFEVGGDYFDYFWLDEERTRLGITVADVTGKAMKASIIAVMTSGMIHSEVGNQKEPARILKNINRPLFLKTDPHFFTTMIFAALDIPGKTLTFANAGHLPPLVLRDGRAAHQPSPGSSLPLGIVAEISPESMAFPLSPGDRVLLYSDGLVEAMSESREMFGFERLEQAFQEAASGSSSDTLRRLLERIERFQGRAEQHDDITLVVVTVL